MNFFIAMSFFVKSRLYENWNEKKTEPSKMWLCVEEEYQIFKSTKKISKKNECQKKFKKIERMLLCLCTYLELSENRDTI